MKVPPNWKLKKIFKSSGMKVTLSKVTETIIDSEFGQTSETLTDYIIYAEIQDVTVEDMSYIPAGELKEGDAWGFFLPVYIIDEVEITVEVNDYITFKGRKYLVTRIEESYSSGDTVVLRAILRRQVGH